MPPSIVNILKAKCSETLFIKNLISVLSINTLNNLVTFVIAIIAARKLGPLEFGVFALASSTSMMVSLLFDMGLSLSLVKKYFVVDENEKDALISGIFVFKLIFLISIAVLVYPFKHNLQNIFFPTASQFDNLFYASIVTAGLLSFWTTIRSVEQAKDDFKSYNNFTFSYFVLRIIAFIFIYALNKLSALNIFMWLYTIPLSIVIMYNLITKYRNCFYVKNIDIKQVKLLKTSLSYGKWVAVSTICYSLLTWLPQFALSKKGLSQQVGYYGAALTFIALFSLLNDAVRTVLMPKIVKLYNKDERLAFRQKIFKLLPIYLIGAGCLLLLASIVQYYVLGEVYRKSVPVFIILGAATIVTIFMGLSNMIIHSLGIPKLDAMINLLRVTLLAMFLVVVPLSALNCSLLFSCTLISGEIILYYYLSKLLKI